MWPAGEFSRWRVNLLRNEGYNDSQSQIANQGDQMDRLKCKACGSESMVPMEVVMDDEDYDELEELLGNEETESRFYTCHVCGDNWLSVKEANNTADCHITFIHQMGMNPVLKRVAHMRTPVVVNDETVDHWDYYLDDDQVDRDVWFSKLRDRRRLLKSICTN